MVHRLLESAEEIFIKLEDIEFIQNEQQREKCRKKGTVTPELMEQYQKV